MSDHLPSDTEKSKPRSPVNVPRRIWVAFTTWPRLHRGGDAVWWLTPGPEDDDPSEAYVLKADADRLAAALKETCESIAIAANHLKDGLDDGADIWESQWLDPLMHAHGEAGEALAAYEGGGS